MRLSFSSVGWVVKLSVAGVLLGACGDDAPRDDDPFQSPYGKLDGGSVACPAGQYTVGTRCVSSTLDAGMLDAAADAASDAAAAPVDASTDARMPTPVVVTP